MPKVTAQQQELAEMIYTRRIAQVANGNEKMAREQVLNSARGAAKAAVTFSLIFSEILEAHNAASERVESAQLTGSNEPPNVPSRSVPEAPASVPSSQDSREGDSESEEFDTSDPFKKISLD
tara:strand:+ start:5011 stop:5376 length:366 start_codon:yes stop_codon:yes gene_type:complete